MRDIDVARDRDDPGVSAAELVKDAVRTNVTGVDDEIGVPCNGRNARIEKPVGIGDEGDENGRFGHTLARAALAESKDIITTSSVHSRLLPEHAHVGHRDDDAADRR